MRCRRAQRYISEYVDGTLDPDLEDSLRRHLEACAECRALLEEFQAMVGEAKTLERLVPPDSIWLKIRTNLRQKRARAESENLSDRPSFSLAPSRLHFAVAAAMGVVVLILVGVLYFQPWNKGMPVERAAVDTHTLVKLNEAEWHYQQAIKALSEVVEAQQGQLDPEVARVFQENLAIVDASLKACRETVRRAPQDLEAQFALMASYKQKVQLLTEWMLAQGSSGMEEPDVRL